MPNLPLTEEEKKFNREKQKQITRLREKKDTLIDKFIGECNQINSEIRYWKERKFNKL